MKNLTGRGERKVSKFAAAEMLFLYSQKKLDPQTMREIQRQLLTDSELNATLKKIELAKLYTTSISEIEIKQDTIDKVAESKTWWLWILNEIRFYQWPTEAKWAFEIALAIFGLVGVLAVVPWQELREIKFLKEAEYILAEVTRVGENSNKSLDSVTPENIFEDESLNLEMGMGVNQLQMKVAQDEMSSLVNPNLLSYFNSNNQSPLMTSFRKEFLSLSLDPIEIQIPVAALVNNPTPDAESNDLVSKNIIENSNTITTSTDSSNSKPQDSSLISEGALYRGDVSITNAAVASEKFIQKITELGGRKAGEVPLGWQKGQGYYFHFTIPENKYQELMTYMSDFGAVKVNKERHERVMPAGILRAIIQVNEAP
jgi:hypothetical protein